jgi:hypothetical protein
MCVHGKQSTQGACPTSSRRRTHAWQALCQDHRQSPCYSSALLKSARSITCLHLVRCRVSARHESTPATIGGRAAVRNGVGPDTGISEASDSAVEELQYWVFSVVECILSTHIPRRHDGSCSCDTDVSLGRPVGVTEVWAFGAVCVCDERLQPAMKLCGTVWHRCSVKE